ncbi:MAG: CoA transferase, partial [Alphaproteobacteria bacterium]|nr:CoA transferase [Alphaproteobacteria bacterium]
MGPLDGIKVLDLTSMVSGPMGAMMLADQGAEVIKVEPVHGEQMRHMAPPHNGVNAVFYSCNRGKKSIALDLKSEDGKAILRRLAAEADVFMQNFRPGAIDRMGFGEAEMRKL